MIVAFRPAAVAIVMTALAAALAGCGGGGSGGEAAGCVDPVPVPDKRLADVPLDLGDSGTVTQVRTETAYVSATVVAESDLDTEFARFPAALIDGGYDVVADENEGVEADIFFARGQDKTGVVKFLRGPCEGQVTIRLTITG